MYCGVSAGIDNKMERGPCKEKEVLRKEVACMYYGSGKCTGVDGHKGRTGDGERQDGRGRLTKTNTFENSIMKPDAFTLI